MQIRILTLAVLITFIATVANSAGPRVAHYEIDVTFTPAESFMEARTTVTFPSSISGPISFYLHGELKVQSIQVEDGDVLFEEESAYYRSDYSLIANRVTVDLGDRETTTLQISYRGHFHPSKARSPSDYMRIDPDNVLLRAYGYSLWFPIFLEAREDSYTADFDAVISTPEALTSVFVGNLVDRSKKGESQVSTWKATDTPLFAAQVTARKYAVVTERGLFAYAMNDERSQASAKRMLAFARELESSFRRRYSGKAGSSQLHLMQMPKYGDISSGNVVGLSDDPWFNIETTSRAQRTLAHELVHSYVRPDVLLSDPIYALVIEGFPSFFHLPVLQEVGWADDYDEYLNRVEEAYLEKRRTGKSRRGWDLPKEKPIVEITPAEISEYKDFFVLSDRVLLFLDYLRRTGGEERFDGLVSELFGRESIDYAGFTKLVLEHIPEVGGDLRRWLETTDFPTTFQRIAGADGKRGK